MPKIAKLVCNRLGWIKPSGLDAKCDNIKAPLFESRYHFGFEEWLFNEKHVIQLNGEELHFGFVECFRNNEIFEPIDVLHLSTRLYPNAEYHNQNTARYVGKILGVSHVTEETYRTILEQHPGIIQRMREELKGALQDNDFMLDALGEFDEAAESKKLFNCLYFRGYRYNLPEESENWDYLPIPNGAIKDLPKNFQITIIGADVIQRIEQQLRVPILQKNEISEENTSICATPLSFRDFPNACYYIGPGFDFEPLWRLSNLCDTFFYANLYTPMEEVERSIKQQLERSNNVRLNSIEIDRSFDEVTHFDLDLNYRNHLYQSYNLFTDEEKKEYTNTFVPAHREDQWLITVNLTRKSTGRSIKLFYFTGEGLASYVALSRNGNYAPKVLCTIQSGVLERPNGIMTRLLNSNNEKPMLWVRGFEKAFEYNDFSDAFAKDELYSQVGIDFSNDWIVPASYFAWNRDVKSKRFCKGFITDNTHQLLSQQESHEISGNKIHWTGVQSIQWNNSSRSLLIITRPVHEKMKADLAHCRDISYWEDHITSYSKKNSATDCIAFLRELDNLYKYDEIHFLPLGLEDEGSLYKSFFEEKLNARLNLYIARPLDYFEIR